MHEKQTCYKPVKLIWGSVFRLSAVVKSPPGHVKGIRIGIVGSAFVVKFTFGYSFCFIV